MGSHWFCFIMVLFWNITNCDSVLPVLAPSRFLFLLWVLIGLLLWSFYFIYHCKCLGSLNATKPCTVLSPPEKSITRKRSIEWMFSLQRLISWPHPCHRCKVRSASEQSVDGKTGCKFRFSRLIVPSRTFWQKSQCFGTHTLTGEAFPSAEEIAVTE